MQNKYFLQVCRDKLTDYIMKAIICPDNFMGEECHIDTQSYFKNTLILSNGVIKNLDTFEEILLELILTDYEVENNLNLTNIEGVYDIKTPLPISRIKKIYVKNKKEKDHILKKIDTNQKGFIFSSLIDVKSIDLIYKLPNIDIKTNPEINYTKELNYYNKLLGMLAYMKNADYYYADINKSIKNYSSDYFSILNKFNNHIKAPKNDFLNKLKDCEISNKFILYLTQNKRVGKEFIQSVIDITKSEIIKKNLNKLITDPLSKLDVLSSLKDEHDDIYFYICMVYINSDKYSNKLSNLKSLLARQVPYSKVQKTLAYLGLYYGYEILDANEEIKIKERYLKKFLQNNTINTKFLLDNKLDYITIESVYQYVFQESKTINSDFEYLDFRFEKINVIEENEQYEKIVFDKYYGTEYLQISKRTQLEYILYKLTKYNDTIFFDKYISVFYNKYFNAAKEIIPIKKENFIEKVKTTALTKSKEKELLNAIKLDD